MEQPQLPVAIFVHDFRQFVECDRSMPRLAANLDGDRLRWLFCIIRKWNYHICGALLPAGGISLAVHAVFLVLGSPVGSKGFHAGKDGAVSGAAADVAVK